MSFPRPDRAVRCVRMCLLTPYGFAEGFLRATFTFAAGFFAVNYDYTRR